MTRMATALLGAAVYALAAPAQNDFTAAMTRLALDARRCGSQANHDVTVGWKGMVQ